jgi:hypothetical protein
MRSQTDQSRGDKVLGSLTFPSDARSTREPSISIVSATCRANPHSCPAERRDHCLISCNRNVAQDGARLSALAQENPAEKVPFFVEHKCPSTAYDCSISQRRSGSNLPASCSIHEKERSRSSGLAYGQWMQPLREKREATPSSRGEMVDVSCPKGNVFSSTITEAPDMCRRARRISRSKGIEPELPTENSIVGQVIKLKQVK